MSLTFSHAVPVSPCFLASFTEDLTDKITTVKATVDFPDDPVVKTSPSNVGDVGSTSGQGTKIPHALWPNNQNMKKKQYENKFNSTSKKIYFFKSNSNSNI